MPTPRRIALAVVTVVALVARAAADPVPGASPPSPPPAAPLRPGTGYWHIVVPFHVTLDSGTKIDLPPSHIVDDPGWQKLDDAFKTCQNDRTRLDAENKSFRATASSWQPGWKTLASTLVVGLVAGFYVGEKL